MTLTRRRALGMLMAGIPAACLGRPAGHLALTALHDRPRDWPREPPPGVGVDASGLEAVPIERHVVPADGVEEAIRALLAQARASGRAVCVAGTRHTMGGQTSLRDALVIDTAAIRSMSLDERTDLLTIGAGARWSDALAYLDPRGRSVAVMQGYSSFSVGGSIGANVHGWQFDRPPLASTIESLRVVTPDGQVLRASRTENSDLFRLVLGGYGLFGVVVDAELRVVPNAVYAGEQYAVTTRDYVAELERHARSDPPAAMAYGRLCVAPSRFLRDALLTVYRVREGAQALPLVGARRRSFARTVFRGSVGSGYGKELRWTVESLFGGEAGTSVTRNQILDEPVSLFQNRDPAMTEILQEYFVPPHAFAEFVDRMRAVLVNRDVDLLNVTVRSVLADDDALLRYADAPMLALVLLFSMQRSLEADARMAPVTRELVDAALAVGGRHYLPYRLHATPDQLRRAYPTVDQFFAEKRRIDPNGLFRNHLFERYATT